MGGGTPAESGMPLNGHKTSKRLSPKLTMTQPPLHPCGMKPTVSGPQVCANAVSANHVHGFGRFNLQYTSRRGGVRRGGSADHLGGLEQECRWNREAEGLGGFEVDGQREASGAFNG